MTVTSLTSCIFFIHSLVYVSSGAAAERLQCTAYSLPQSHLSTMQNQVKASHKERPSPISDTSYLGTDGLLRTFHEGNGAICFECAHQVAEHAKIEAEATAHRRL